MANCYCANYYGSIHCRNMVTKFGERCKLCLALKSGASLSDGLLPQHMRWLETPQSAESASLKSPTTDGYRNNKSTAGRSTRMGGNNY